MTKNLSIIKLQLFEDFSFTPSDVTSVSLPSVAPARLSSYAHTIDIATKREAESDLESEWWVGKKFHVTLYSNGAAQIKCDESESEITILCVGVVKKLCCRWWRNRSIKIRMPHTSNENYVRKKKAKQECQVIRELLVYFILFMSFFSSICVYSDRIFSTLNSFLIRSRRSRGRKLI